MNMISSIGIIELMFYAITCSQHHYYFDCHNNSLCCRCHSQPFSGMLFQPLPGSRAEVGPWFLRTGKWLLRVHSIMAIILA